VSSETWYIKKACSFIYIRIFRYQTTKSKITHSVFFAWRCVKPFPRRYFGGALKVFGSGRGFHHRHRHGGLVLQTSVMQRWCDAVSRRVFGGPHVYFQTAQRVPFRVAATKFLCGHRKALRVWNSQKKKQREFTNYCSAWYVLKIKKKTLSRFCLK